jgi:hypothetical protein
MATPNLPWYGDSTDFFRRDDVNTHNGIGKMIIYDNNKFVAVGLDSRPGSDIPFTGKLRNSIIWSLEGVNWITVPQLQGSWLNNVNQNIYPVPGGYSIVSGNGKWLATGIGNDSSIVSANDSDMHTWTKANPFGAPNGVGLYSAYNNGLWVAVGGYCATSDKNIAYASETSLDTWTQVSAFGTNGAGRSVAYGNNLWIAVGESATNTNNCYTSSDGMTWVGQSLLGGGKLSCVAYGNGVWMVTGKGTGGNNTAYSTDNGVTWNNLSQFGTAYGNYVTYQNNTWVVCGQGTQADNTQIYYSKDNLATWNGITNLFGNYRYGSGYGFSTRIIYANGYWVANGGYVHNVQYSTDLNNWNISTTLFDEGLFAQTDSTAFGNNVWVVVAWNDGAGNSVASTARIHYNQTTVGEVLSAIPALTNFNTGDSNASVTYSITSNFSGVTPTCSLTSPPPPGMFFSGFRLSGTPTVPGTYVLTLNLRETSNNISQTYYVTVVVRGSPNADHCVAYISSTKPIDSSAYIFLRKKATLCHSKYRIK